MMKLQGINRVLFFYCCCHGYVQRRRHEEPKHGVRKGHWSAFSSNTLYIHLQSSLLREPGLDNSFKMYQHLKLMRHLWLLLYGLQSSPHLYSIQTAPCVPLGISQLVCDPPRRHWVLPHCHFCTEAPSPPASFWANGNQAIKHHLEMASSEQAMSWKRSSLLQQHWGPAGSWIEHWSSKMLMSDAQ